MWTLLPTAAERGLSAGADGAHAAPTMAFHPERAKGIEAFAFDAYATLFDVPSVTAPVRGVCFRVVATRRSWSRIAGSSPPRGQADLPAAERPRAADPRRPSREPSAAAATSKRRNRPVRSHGMPCRVHRRIGERLRPMARTATLWSTSRGRSTPRERPLDGDQVIDLDRRRRTLPRRRRLRGSTPAGAMRSARMKADRGLQTHARPSYVAPDSPESG